MTLSKKMLRQQALQQRQSLTTEQAEMLGAQIIQYVIKNIRWTNFTCVHVYLSCKKRKEINTWPLLDYLWSAQKHITTVTNRLDVVKKQIDCCIVNRNTVLEKSAFDIFEPVKNTEKINPQQIDLMILPLLACDNQGFRLGYGKGYYDHLLARCAASMQRIGINYFLPLAEKIPQEAHDLPIHQLVLPGDCLKFQSR
jgi:5-formyltetrahydrofolate cyclo-ligase